jgi:CrcB protein
MEFARTAASAADDSSLPAIRRGGRTFFNPEAAFMLYLFLAAGGVLGTLARYRMGIWVHGWAGTGMPWGTFAINLVGSFVLGLATQFASVLPVSPELRGLVTVGFCGAFTTFSTFMFETATLLQDGEWGRAAAYALGSLALGLAAMLLGLSTAALLTRSGG